MSNENFLDPFILFENISIFSPSVKNDFFKPRPDPSLSLQSILNNSSSVILSLIPPLLSSIIIMSLSIVISILHVSVFREFAYLASIELSINLLID